MLPDRARFAICVFRFVLPAALFCTVLPPAACAQSAAPPPVASQAAPAKPPAAASLTAHADEVSLDLFVRTRRNKPVLDLKPSDLAITDDGSPVSLTDLHLVTGDSRSNHLITLLFDPLDPSSSKTARNLAAKFLGIVPQKGYSLAVLQMNGRLRILEPFTSNRKLVDTAIATATPSNPTTLPAGFTPAEKDLLAVAQSDSLNVASAQRADAQLLIAELQDYQHIVEDQHVYPSFAALQAIADSQRHIAGRKLIVWFSEGIRANSDARDAIRSIVGEASRAGVAICAINVNSIDQQVGGQMQAAMAMSTLGMGGAVSSSSLVGVQSNGGISGANPGFTPGTELNPSAARNTTAFEFGGMDSDQSPLLNLASGTGGVYIHAGGGIGRQLDQLHNDLRNYYEASYVPATRNYNGAFHSIAVRPLRKGLIVRSRAGYFAVPPDTTVDILPWEAPLLNILAKPQLPTTIAFRTAVLRLGDMPGGNTADLTVEVPVSALEIHNDANTRIASAHATLLALVKDDKGAVLRRFSQDVPLHESPDMLRADPDQVITMERHFSAEPGVYTLETAVLDNLSNAAGAQRSSFTIDPPPPGPSLSDIVLVRRVDPVHDDNAGFDPMRYEDGHIVPDLSAELPENTTALSLFFMIHPAAGSTSQPRLQLQILRNHQSLGNLPIELHTVSGAGAAIPYYGKLQASLFPPGNYQVQALLTQDGQTVTRSASFSVEGTIAASNAPVASFTADADPSDLASDRRLVSTAATRSSLFVIASPAHPVPAPSAVEVNDTIQAARQRALSWFDSLENFFCVEVTNHSIDVTGRGDWKHKDTLVELIRYVDHHETRSTLSLNGGPSSTPADQLGFAWSVGEFGAMFHVLFDPGAHATFAWKESDVLDGQPVQVFTFQVALAHSTFNLSDRNNHVSPVGFHGLLYLDAATRSPRRITFEADDIPHTLDIRASSVSVDYSWISINNHDYLLPIRGAVSLHEAKHAPVLNEFQFRDYRRFGSRIRILTPAEAKALSATQPPN